MIEQDNVIYSATSLPANAQIIVRNPAESVYRFLPSRFATRLIEVGELRLSRLADHRTIASPGRCDPREGHVRGGWPMNNAFLETATPALSLSLSRFPLAALASRFRETDDAPPAVCIEVRELGPFLAAVDLALRAERRESGRPVVGAAANDVYYIETPKFKFGRRGAPVHPAFVKPNIVSRDGGLHHYWIEAEVKAVWDYGPGPEVEPIVLQIPELREHVRILPAEQLLPDSAIEHVRVSTIDPPKNGW